MSDSPKPVLGCTAAIVFSVIVGFTGEARGYDAFLSTPYYGTASINTYFDHQYPTYSTDADGRVVIHTGEDVPDCNPYCYDGHNGWDFNVWYQRVLAAADGQVTAAGWADENNYLSSYGLRVKILHANGYSTLYGHLSALNVQVGDRVTQGQIIGTTGTTGNSSGTHLHFTVYNDAGWAVDPFGWTDQNKDDPWEVRHPDAESWFMWSEGEWVGQPLPDPSPITNPFVEVEDRDPIAFSKGCSQASCPNWVESWTGWPTSNPHHWETRDTDAVSDYWARWKPTFDEEGTYEVWLYLPTTASSSRLVPYTIQHATGTQLGIVDHLIQQDRDNDNQGDEHWRCLGSYRFAKGNTGYLQLSSATGDSPETSQMSADVVRFWKVDETVDPSQPKNKFGVGMSNAGDVALFGRAAELSADGGWTLFTCWGIQKNMGSTPQECIDAVRELASRNQNIVARLSPPDGQRNIRDDANDTANTIRTNYSNLAQKYEQVVRDFVAALPQDFTGHLAVQVGNELNLCEEWKITNGQTLTSSQMATEVAAFQRDVAAALSDVTASLVVLNSPLSPGGPASCSQSGWTCCTDGLAFLSSMVASVPTLFTSGRFQGWASHSYPANQLGAGFFVPFEQAAYGLHYYEKELPLTKNPALPVYITETGWPTTGPNQIDEDGAGDDYSWETIGSMLVSAWTSTDANNLGWLRDPRVVAVAPFLLNWTPDWQYFAWLDGNANPRSQFSMVQQARRDEIDDLSGEPLDALIIEEAGTIPDLLLPGTSAHVVVRVKNTGSTTWTSAAPYPFRLGATSDNAVTWSEFGPCDGYSTPQTGRANDSRVFLCAGDTVPPGETHDFSFSIQPESASGPVTFGVRMVQESIAWFGEAQAWSLPVRAPDCSLHHGDLLGCNAAGCTYFGCSEQCHGDGRTYCDAGCNAYCADTWQYEENGHFSNYMAGWLPGENGHLVNIQDGSCTNDCVSPPAGYPVAVARPNGAGGRVAIWQNIPDPQPGTYRLRGFLRTSSAAQRAWIQADNGDPSYPHCSTSETSSTNWTYLECFFGLPTNQSNVVHVTLFASNASGTGGGWVAWDDVALLGPIPPCEYFQGNVDDCDLAGCAYYWCSNQCHHAGTSECGAGCIEYCPTGNAEICPSGTTCTRPTSMTAGTSAAAKLYVKNTGTTTWTAGTTYRLSSLASNDFAWSDFECGGVCNGPGDCRVVLCNSVAPGQVYDFDFSMTAPGSSGTYDLDTQMIRETAGRFGEVDAWDVSVTAPPVDNADQCPTGSTCIRPTSMAAGSTASVKIYVKNTGNTTWSEGTYYRLGSLTSNDFLWSGFECGGSCSGPGNCRAKLCSSVGPNQIYDFDFSITAPATTGTYDLDTRMVRDGVAWFGDSELWDISVTAPLVDDADLCPTGYTCVFPTTIVAGTTASVKVYAKNTGNTTWTTSGYRLNSLASNDFLWGTYECGGVCNGPGDCRASLCQSVAAGQIYDFDFKITAPTTRGTYDLDMKMARDSGQFGDSEYRDVVVFTNGNDSEVLEGESTLPGLLWPGVPAPVRIRVKNWGNTTWTAGTGFKLGAASKNGVTWSSFSCGGYFKTVTDARAYLCKDVPPGGTHDFSLYVGVPLNYLPTSVSLAVRMVQEGVAWFGETQTWTMQVFTEGGSECDQCQWGEKCPDYCEILK